MQYHVTSAKYIRDDSFHRSHEFWRLQCIFAFTLICHMILRMLNYTLSKSINFLCKTVRPKNHEWDLKRPHWSLLGVGAVTKVANLHFIRPNKSNLAFLKVVLQWKFGLGSLVFFSHFILSLTVNFRVIDYLRSENRSLKRHFLTFSVLDREVVLWICRKFRNFLKSAVTF